MKFITVFLVFIAGICSAQTTPLIHGHAHNDYVHKTPLFEALKNGFTSIEIDVFLHNDKLIVSHGGMGLDSKPTIQNLYLDPIQKVIELNGGTVYKGTATPVILMIDFKTSGAETYDKLKAILKQYQNILTVYKGTQVIHQRAINILISGASPATQLLAQDSSIATIDASISSLGDSVLAQVSTRFSNPYQKYFTWKGKGKMPTDQQEKLNSLVAKAHALYRQIRFYHIPDKPSVWKVLIDAGVDWINTDKLAAYSKFERLK